VVAVFLTTTIVTIAVHGLVSSGFLSLAIVWSDFTKSEPWEIRRREVGFYARRCDSLLVVLNKIAALLQF
jgi:hypothetical protein